MKLQTKMLITMGIACAAFIVLTNLLSIFFPNLLALSAFIILFFIGMFGLFYYYFLQPIESLHQQLNHINTEKSVTQRLPINKDEELNKITLQINEILDNNETTLAHLQQQFDNNINELAKINSAIELASSEPKNPTPPENYKDALTELPNRAFFNAALNKAISHAKRHNQLCAILIIDLDAFHDINKTLGRNFGDYVLNKMGHRLANTLRTEDTLARLDGDEFIILLTDIKKAKFASVVAEKILQICKKPIKDFFLTASIGISIYPEDGTSLEDLLKNADAALYKAKQQGGNKYHFHAHEMDVEAHEFIKLESELREAIEKNQLVLYYQPKLNIKSGGIVGIEALLRWAHPTLGILSPAQFLSVAEDTGMMLKVGEWALREACKMNKHWQNEGYEHFSIALNLSPKQFNHPTIVTTISAILAETELNPKYLELEINESTVMEDFTAAKKHLDDIKATGIKISIDHFGVGCTSISHLKQFPISTIKIDQSFIKGVPNNPDDVAITNAFIALAHNLGLEIVAEGVETTEQVQHLTSQDCDIIQGYFLSHPLPAQKIELQFKKLMDRALF